MENLVCAELSSGLSFEMLQDKLVTIINDGALFAITTEENAKKYEEVFYPLDTGIMKEYWGQSENGLSV